jgi:peptide/nickel transport system permease protein
MNMPAETTSLKIYLLKRSLRIIPIMLGIIFIGFTLINIAPGDPLEYVLGFGTYPPEFIEATKIRFGLDRPFYERFFIYLANVFRGNLGFSYVFNAPVIEVIADRILPTLLLMGSQLIFVVLVGVPLGILAARKPYSKFDTAITSFSLIGVSMPVFWLGLLLLQIFSISLGLFPAQGMASLRVEEGLINQILDILHHLFLPALTLFLINLGLMTRITRTGMLEALRSEYIVAARSKGLLERTILFKHALKNSMLPILTIIGLQIGWMLAGAVLVETVFAWPGLGRLLYSSVGARDYPVVMGIFLLIALAVVLSNFIVDILYSVLDPRVRRG